MKVRIDNYTKENNRYTNIKVVSEDGKEVIYKDTAELCLALSKVKGLEFENFRINPNFKLIVSNNSKSNNNDIGQRIENLERLVSNLAYKVPQAIDRNTSVLSIIDRGQKSISENVSSLPSKMGTDEKLEDIREKLGNIESLLLDLKISSDKNYSLTEELCEKVKENSGYIKKLEKLDTTIYDIIVKKLNDKLISDKQHKYPRNSADLNTWRYDGLPREALHFEYSYDKNGNLKYDIANKEQDCISAFSGINLPTSGLKLDYEPNLIIVCRDAVEFYDNCRVCITKAVANDLNNKTEDKLQTLDDTSLNLLLVTATNSVMLGIKNYEYGLQNKVYAVGTMGTALSILFSCFKVIKNETLSWLDLIGNNRARVKNRSLNINYEVTANNSTLGVATNDIVNTSDTLDTLEVSLAENIKKYVIYTCRIFNVNMQKSMVYMDWTNKLMKRVGKRNEKWKNYVDLRNKPCYKFVKNTLVTSAVFDMRLFMVYLIYCQQPYFGFNVKDYELNNNTVVSGNERANREALFNILQNAYFAAKLILLTVDNVDMIQKDDRVKWLDNYDWVGTQYGYDRDNPEECEKYLHIEEFLKYLKLGICIQGLSPICADKLVSLFCKYGHILWLVDKDKSDRSLL